MDPAPIREWLRTTAQLIDQEKDRLTELDSAIGDGDHGVNMQRGFTAVARFLQEDRPQDETAGQLLVATGDTLISTIGGASGPLFGSSFRALGKALDRSGPESDDRRLAAALAAARDSIQRLGAARPGDKTMYDAYGPAADAFARAAEAGDGLAASARAAAAAADEGARATEPMQARRGRASYLGLRSVGHQDPGAASTALVFRALATALEAK
ncbi:dihydroxyacetone kinase subunit L [Streptomyces sp. SID486]|uniref:dihydroxyacetone kinase subunit DhaL n=1 Tax=Streptomyces sp. SID486 TaxID=2690264 RepID=UPI00136CD2DF|nr:dihydroxyacetone kinase subunit DhaL [Streptomyces sp. SID486]MYX99479.1 dihydroxyacetone kinase subunit L [Streptomyces sp. SID486]